MTTTEGQAAKAAKAPLYKALSRAQGMGKGAAKSCRHGMGYDYASSEQVIIAARAALSGSGLALMVVSTRVVCENDRATVIRTYLLAHESGAAEKISQDWPIGGGPHKKDPGKALASALTAMLAYQLRDLLLIPRVARGDEPNEEPRGEQQQQRQQRQQPRPDEENHGHHPSFAADRPRFMSELTRRGLTYDRQVKPYCISRGWGKPSAWTSENRAKWLIDCAAGKFPDLAEFVAPVTT